MTNIYAYLRGYKEEVNRLLSGDSNLEEKLAQPLSEHINLALSAVDEIKESKLWNVYVRLFKFDNNTKFDEATVEKWLKFATVFHDFGKILYQRNFKTYKNEKYLNFIGHEYFSTFLADKFMNFWLEDDLVGKLEEYKVFRWVVCASILYHHHAMGLKSRSYPDVVKFCNGEEFERFIIKSYRILHSFFHEFRDFKDHVIANFINDLKSTIEKIGKTEGDLIILDHSYISSVIRYVEDLNVRIWEKFVEDASFRKQMILTTNILILIDYHGSKDRKGSIPKFGIILDEFMKIYRDHKFSKQICL